MQLLQRGIEVIEPELRIRILPGNRPFVQWADDARFADEIARFSRADAEAWLRWKHFWATTREIIGPYLLSYPPTLGELLERARALQAEDVFTTVLTTSLAELADRFFESDTMRGNFSVPHDLGSVYDRGTGLATALAAAMSGYSETGASLPSGYVRGGMGRLTEVMADIVREQGVSIRTSAPVQRILVENGKATGVELADGERLEARIVISNADPKRTFLRLIDPAVLSPEFLGRIRGLRTDVAPLKFLCALSELPEYFAFPGSDLPTRGPLIINPDRAYHERAWDDARHGRLPEAPIMSINMPSVWDQTIAPRGCHTASFWILFAPVHLAEGIWPERRDEMAERLLTQLDKYSPNFRRAIVDYVLLTPWDLEQDVLLTDGNIHHVDITPSQMFWQRPLPELARYRAPIAGLFLCGAGQHPYGEVSGAPGHNAAHAILEDLGVIEPGSWEQRFVM
jgi:phytoene dehydrogenase-like protein